MQTRNNPIKSNPDISLLIQSALLNFKAVSREIRKSGTNGHKLSNLSLYVLLCLRNSKPLLRNDFMKRLNVNYYDAGKALDQLVLAGIVIRDEGRERSNIKTLNVSRIRYRMSLAGDIFINQFLSSLNNIV